MFGSVGRLFEDVVKIATLPVLLSVEVTSAIVKPVAEVAEDIVKSIVDVVK